MRILLAVVALVAAGLAGWAMAGGYGDDRPAAGSAATQDDPAAGAGAPQGEPAPGAQAAPDGGAPSGDPPGRTRPSPRPRIVGFGSEPVFASEGGFWRLPAGPGEAILITDAEHATKVEFLLTPTGTGVAGHAVTIGVDTQGRDAYSARWRYPDRPLLAHLTVRATGPGGTAEHTVGVYHPDPAGQS